jgi:hypothetical protein
MDITTSIEVCDNNNSLLIMVVVKKPPTRSEYIAKKNSPAT